MEQGKGRDIGRLSKALSTFAATTKYSMLKTLQVGRFVDNAPTEIGVLSEYTFEKLIELGSRKISKLRWLTPSQEERLLMLLAALSEGEEVVPMLPPSLVRPCDTAPKVVEEEEIGSVKLELDLREGLKSLRAHDDYNRIKDKTLSVFWDPTWVRAPFEEAFTTDQLAHMDLSMLFKKRSTSNRRVRHMIEALGRALETLEAKTENVEPSEIRVLKEGSHQGEDVDIRSRSLAKYRPPLSHRWLEELKELSLATRGRLSLLGIAGISYVLDSCEVLKDSSKPCERALAAFPDLFTTHELQEILDLGELRPELQQRLQNWITSDETFERACSALKESLRGPGAHTANLLRSVPSLYNLPQAVQFIMCHILVRALGAQPVSLEKLVIPDIWTLNPNLLSLILKELKRRKTLRPLDVLSMICPEMDQILLNVIIESHRDNSRGSLSNRKNKVSPLPRGKKRASHGPVKA